LSPAPSSLHKTWLGALVLLRNLGGNYASAPGPQRRRTPAGTEYDYYIPRQPVGKTLIFAYGLALSGEKDPRAVQFAQALAATGVTVVMPHLPGLKDYTPSLADQAALRDLIATLHPTNGPLALFGFSIGGGLALTVAADPAVAGLVNPLILFGAYHDFPDFPRAFADISSLPPCNQTEWDDYI
jgi:pimeloyl-ACP methyl ester carboxylesterase